MLQRCNLSPLEREIAAFAAAAAPVFAVMQYVFLQQFISLCF
jgi:hypothetical protein